MANTLKVPHTLVLLLGMMCIALISTWVVPQGFLMHHRLRSPGGISRDLSLS